MQNTISTKIVNGKPYKARVVTAGLRTEVTQHSNVRFYGGQRLYTPIRNNSIKNKRKDSISRAQKKIRLLTFSNSKKIAPLLVRLSYAEHITSRKVAQEDMAKFMRSLRARYPYIKYLYVFEFTKLGRIHAHILIFGLAYIPFSEIETLWGKGGTRVERSKGREQTGNYVGKYCGKALSSKKSSRGYSVSQNLEKPVIDYMDCFINEKGEWSLQHSHIRGNVNQFITISIYKYDVHRR